MYRRVLLSVLLLASAPAVALAATIQFDHIEYDPAGADSGHEWVRIHNVSGAPLDLTNWRFVEGGTNHKIKAVGTPVVPADGYAVIAEDAAQYELDHAGSTDVLFDSTFSLSNTGEQLAFKNASSTVVAETSYVAESKPKATAAPTAPSKSTSKIGSKKSAPRLLQKESPKITATVADAPLAYDFGFWPWLVGALALGVGAGGALWYVRQGRSQTGYTVIDISDKSV